MLKGPPSIPRSKNVSFQSNWLMKPMYGSSRYVQPMVTAKPGIMNDTQNMNSRP